MQPHPKGLLCFQNGRVVIATPGQCCKNTPRIAEHFGTWHIMKCHFQRLIGSCVYFQAIWQSETIVETKVKVKSSQLPELNPVSVALSDWEYYYSPPPPPDGMLVHCKVTPPPPSNLYTWLMKRETTWRRFLFKETPQSQRPGSSHQLSGSKSNVLTTRSPCLHRNKTETFNHVLRYKMPQDLWVKRDNAKQSFLSKETTWQQRPGNLQVESLMC